jgi:hypothetical protein
VLFLAVGLENAHDEFRKRIRRGYLSDSRGTVEPHGLKVRGRKRLNVQLP